MKIECCESAIDMIYSSLAESCRTFLKKPLEEKYGRQFDRAQFFSSFFSPNMEYPFMLGEFAYYPLTIILKNRAWEIQWIKWSVNNIPGRYEKLKPYVFEDRNRRVEICDDVPPEFVEKIAGKELVWMRNKDDAAVYMRFTGGREEIVRTIGLVGAWFEKELKNQIPKIIEAKTGLKIDRHWDIALYADSGFAEENGTHYLKGRLSSFWVNSVPICVCWKGDIKPYDYIPSGGIEFDLAEQAPNCTPYTMDQLRRFIENGGTEFIEE